MQPLQGLEMQVGSRHHIVDGLILTRIIQFVQDIIVQIAGKAT